MKNNNGCYSDMKGKGNTEMLLTHFTYSLK